MVSRLSWRSGRSDLDGRQNSSNSRPCFTINFPSVKLHPRSVLTTAGKSCCSTIAATQTSVEVSQWRLDVAHKRSQLCAEFTTHQHGVGFTRPVPIFTHRQNIAPADADSFLFGRNESTRWCQFWRKRISQKSLGRYSNAASSQVFCRLAARALSAPVVLSAFILFQALQYVLRTKLTKVFSRLSFPIPRFVQRWKKQVSNFNTEYDLQRLVPLLIMYFCILMAYTVLRDIKDVLIVTAPNSGAEAIPFLRTWVVVPVAFLAMALYARLTDFIPPNRLFVVTLLPFIAFFTLFGTVLYPMRNLLHPVALGTWLRSILPAGFRGAVAIVENWTFSLFYVICDLWGSMILSVGFWGFANNIYTVQEARKVYPLLGLGGNVPSLLLAGAVISMFSKQHGRPVAGQAAVFSGLNQLLGVVVGCGVTILAMYMFLVNQRAQRALSEPPLSLEAQRKPKKMSTVDGIRLMAGSPYLRNLAVMVVSYAIAMVMLETLWKYQVKLLCPDPTHFSQYMGQAETMTGMATLVSTFMSGWLLRHTGWGTVAMITPVVTLVSGAVFLALSLVPSTRMVLPSFLPPGSPLAASLAATTPLAIMVTVGLVQNAVAKAAKYSLFDPTKEMVFIPLDKESKSKGKATVDVLSQVLGKSGGAVLLQLCMCAFGSLGAATPAVSVIFVLSCVAGILAVHDLEKHVRPLFAQQTQPTTQTEPTPQQQPNPPAALPVATTSVSSPAALSPAGLAAAGPSVPATMPWEVPLPLMPDLWARDFRVRLVIAHSRRSYTHIRTKMPHLDCADDGLHTCAACSGNGRCVYAPRQSGDFHMCPMCSGSGRDILRRVLPM